MSTPRMTGRDAEARARELNAELGRRGVADSYWIEVELAPGEWTVERREAKRGWWLRVLDAWGTTGASL